MHLPIPNQGKRSISQESSTLACHHTPTISNIIHRHISTPNLKNPKTQTNPRSRKKNEKKKIESKQTNLPSPTSHFSPPDPKSNPHLKLPPPNDFLRVRENPTQWMLYMP
ncbi:hypothetical protein EYC80_001971 [Monilinia laxa]|uniref:Uncharacterized protein n=1 Tax=Monilinia laxa TaxID=61186 RepID=A0A5N6K6R2_MONLA|nr:hypothetical protein EYC80_001971 [Monilinia laxa]